MGKPLPLPMSLQVLIVTKTLIFIGDGVGNRARFGNPYSGVFVKNPEYAGNSDEYDFYLTDRHNHAIRILSPLGQVTTYAGRGSASLNSNPWGYANGTAYEKMHVLIVPKGIAWDERDNTIYVGDANNYRIRKIGLKKILMNKHRIKMKK